MAHSAAFDTFALDEMLTNVAADMNSPDDLRFWVAGGETSIAKEYTLEARAHIIQRLTEYGIKTDMIHIKWGENPDGILDMVLDTSNGQSYVTRSDVSDLDRPQHPFDYPR